MVNSSLHHVCHACKLVIGFYRLRKHFLLYYFKCGDLYSKLMLFRFSRKPIWPGVDKDFCGMLGKVIWDLEEIKTTERFERYLRMNKIPDMGDTESLNLNQ